MKKLAVGRRKLVTAMMFVSLAAILPASDQLAQAAEVQKAQPATVLVLGDSISAEYGLTRGTGWVAKLAARLTELDANWKVMNASISGETTAGGRTRIAGLLKRQQPVVVILELGANDALRGLDLNATAANLDQIGELSRAAGAQLVVLGMQVPPNYGRTYTERFAAIFAEVAKARQGQLVPFFLEPIAGRRDAFQSDAIHPTEAVQGELLDTAWPAIERALAASRENR